MRDLHREPSALYARSGSRRRARLGWLAALTLSAGLAGLATLSLRDSHGPALLAARASLMPAEMPSATGLSAPRVFGSLIDPDHRFGAEPATFAASRPLSAEWRPTVAQPFTVASLPPTIVAPPVAALAEPLLAAPAAPEASPQAALAPLPPARPDELAAPQAQDGADTTMVAPLPVTPLPLRRPADAPAATAAAPETLRTQPRRTARAAAPAPEAAAQHDGRSFFQRLFGASQGPSGAQLAYAPADGDGGGSLGSRLGLGFPGLSAPKPPPGIAIYDIGSRMVYLPNGERLEAHSGLGEMRNNVRYAHVRMRGPTPPHTYDLVEREALFHGVRAIRLNPVGGSQAIHGRAGLLAHTYLLGPSGDSNGCISIRDYDRFLQAYLRGEIRRLIVVATRAEAVQAAARAVTRVSQR